MYFSFFNVESIRGFTSRYWLYDTLLHTPLGFPSTSKWPHLNTLKLLVATFSNQDKKVILTQVDEYGALPTSSEFMRTCHNTNIIVQTKGGYAS